MTDISLSNGRLRSVTVNGSEEIPVCAMILAIGHSARDTFEMLFRREIVMEPKPFAVGARIEHLQKDVNVSLYGAHADDPALPVGEYQLSYTKTAGEFTPSVCAPEELLFPARVRRKLSSPTE